MELTPVSAVAPVQSHAFPISATQQALPEAGAVDAPTFEMLPGAPVSDESIASPVGKIVQKYGRVLLNIPGAVSVSWGAKHDGGLRVNFRSDQHAGTAKALLESTIEGFKLGIGIFKKGPYTGPAAGRTGDLVRSVAAMEGVWSYKYAETSPWVDGHVTFRTINKAVIEQLNPIIRDRIPFGTKSNGQPRMMNIHWRAGVPQPRSH